MEHRSQSPRRSTNNGARHSAILAAEVKRVERELRLYGPMPVSRLARLCGEAAWRDGTLEEVVREGIRQRRLKRLPLGWVASRR
jgi:hypothetical protein